MTAAPQGGFGVPQEPHKHVAYVLIAGPARGFCVSTRDPRYALALRSSWPSYLAAIVPSVGEVSFIGEATCAGEAGATGHRRRPFVDAQTAGLINDLTSWAGGPLRWGASAKGGGTLIVAARNSLVVALVSPIRRKAG